MINSITQKKFMNVLSSNLPKFTVKIGWEINIIAGPPLIKNHFPPSKWEKPNKSGTPPPVGWFPTFDRF